MMYGAARRPELEPLELDLRNEDQLPVFSSTVFLRRDGPPLLPPGEEVLDAYPVAEDDASVRCLLSDCCNSSSGNCSSGPDPPPMAAAASLRSALADPANASKSNPPDPVDR